MKILVAGLGSIARRHIKNLKDIDPTFQINVWRQKSRKSGLDELAPLVDRVFFEKDDALAWEPDVTFITNPAPMHVDTALPFARRGSNLFIEKPLSVDERNIDELLTECKKHKCILMVGYVLRFFKPLQMVKQVIDEGRIGRVLYIRAVVGQYLPDWRPGCDYRQTVSARRDLGGGAVYELSHELDYVRWLGGAVASVSAQVDTLSNLEIDVNDIAEIVMTFCSGAIGSVHLDMIDRARNRTCRVVGTNGTVVWDATDGDRVRLYAAQSGAWKDVYKPGQRDVDDMYVSMLRHFFDCIRTGTEPGIGGEEGKRVVEILLAVYRSAEKKEVVQV